MSGPPPRKHPGRPRTTPVPKLPVFRSMEVMSEATGIPLDLLRVARKEGCTFQKSNQQVDCGVFVRWWFDRQLSDDDKENWTRRDKRASAMTKEHKLDVARRSAIPWTEADAFITELAGPMFSGEIDRLAQELPPRLKGRGEIVIRDELRRQKSVMKKNIESKLKQWKEKQS